MNATRTENVAVAIAFCCIEGGGSISGCSCVKPDHGTAWIKREVSARSLWSDQRLAEAHGLIADVVRDHSIAEDKLPEIAGLLTEIHKADELLAGILHDRRAA